LAAAKRAAKIFGDENLFIGGDSSCSSHASDESTEVELADVWSMRSEEESWRRVGAACREAPFKPPVMTKHTAVIHGGTMHVYGGVCQDMEQYTLDGSSGLCAPRLGCSPATARLLESSWKLHLASGVWSAGGVACPPPRRGHTVVTHGGEMFVFGGEVVGGAARYCNETWAMDLVTGAWRLVDTAPDPPAGGTKKKKKSAAADPEAGEDKDGEDGDGCHGYPPPRELHSAWVFDGAMFVFGGKGLDDDKAPFAAVAAGTYFDDLWRLDLPPLSSASPATDDEADDEALKKKRTTKTKTTDDPEKKFTPQWTRLTGQEHAKGASKPAPRAETSAAIFKSRRAFMYIHREANGSTYLDGGLQLAMSRRGRHRWHVMGNEKGSQAPGPRAGARWGCTRPIQLTLLRLKAPGCNPCTYEVISWFQNPPSNAACTAAARLVADDRGGRIILVGGYNCFAAGVRYNPMHQAMMSGVGLYKLNPLDP
jgi:hypothetical protein